MSWTDWVCARCEQRFLREDNMPGVVARQEWCSICLAREVERLQDRLKRVSQDLLDRARLYQKDDWTEGALGGWGWRDIASALRAAVETAEEEE